MVWPFILACLAPLQEPSIAWGADLEGVLAESSRTGTPVVAVFVAPWCTACRQFRSETLRDPKVTEVGPRLLWARVNIDRSVALARQYDIRSVPQSLLFDSYGELRLRLAGVVSARTFRDHLDHLLNGSNEAFAPPQSTGFEQTWLPDGYRSRATCLLNVGYGPLHLPSQSPFQSLRLGLLPRTPSTLSEESLEFRWTETWVNLWAFNRGSWLVDAEMLQTDASFSYGLSDTLQLELGFSQRSRFGGVMDAFIQEFHDTFHIDQGGRDDVPRDDFGMEFHSARDGKSARLTGRDRGSFSESILVGMQQNLTCGTDVRPAIAYALTLRADLGDPDDLRKDEPFDATVSLSASKQVGDFYLYLSVGWGWFGKEEFLGFDLRTTQGAVLAAVEWKFDTYGSFLLQYLLSEGVTRRLGHFSDPAHELSFGLKVELQPNTVLEVGIVENVFLRDNSPDFGLHAGFAVRF